MTPLSRLLLEDRPAEATVCLGGTTTRTWSELQAKAAGVAAQVRSFHGGRWLVGSESAFDFVLALLGVWHGGGVAVLPSNLQQGTLLEMASGLSGTLGDDGVRIDDLPHIQPEQAGTGAPIELALDRQQTALELYTSGSTARPVAVPKRLAQLEDELVEHERLWGASLERAVALSTVSHQHIYGLLFRLLWPLCSGRSFSEYTLFHWESILPEMAATDSCYLISSPAHLSRLYGAAGHVGAVSACRAVFSSGSPLSSCAAAEVRKQLGHWPIEVIGSTETGGIGWRCQERANDPWQPFREVELSLDGEQLRVRSPFTNRDEDGGFTMGDRARILGDGCFELLGRADRIVKVAGKRVSLQEVEDRLRSYPGVREVAVLSLDAGPQQGDPRIAAVVVLDATTRALMITSGRTAVNVALRERVLETLDPVAVPRQFRYVHELPANAQGKVPMEALRQLFQPRKGEPVQRPERLGRTAGENWLELRLRVPEDLCYLEGHFDRFPVVAGVVQLEWIHEMAAELLGVRPTVARLQKVKFHRLLQSGQSFSLRLEHDRVRHRIGYLLHDGELRFASGFLVLQRPLS